MFSFFRYYLNINVSTTILLHFSLKCSHHQFLSSGYLHLFNGWGKNLVTYLNYSCFVTLIQPISKFCYNWLWNIFWIWLSPPVQMLPFLTWTAAIICYPIPMRSPVPSRDQSFSKVTFLELKTDYVSTLIEPSKASHPI